MSLPYLQPYLGLSNGLNTLHAAGAGAAVGGWKELGRTTLGATSDTITVSSLSDKRYYMFLVDAQASGTINSHTRLNSDSGSNYSYRYSNDGGADGTGTSQNIMLGGSSAGAYPMFEVSYIANYSTKEKLLISHGVGQNTAGAGNAPNRRESVGKHAQTSNPVSAINKFNGGAGDYATGSECVVLGYDPLDDDTNGYWQELASVTASGSSTNLSSGTISGKKYLWIECFQEGTSADLDITFNNDSGSNYSDRYSLDGSNGTRVSTTRLRNWLHQGYAGQSSFSNIFIINNASKEKLVIGHSINTGGIGSANDPNRGEWTGKWTNTSNQITEIDLDSTSGNFGTNSILKVWGAD
jgi:hypothetical protein